MAADKPIIKVFSYTWGYIKQTVWEDEGRAVSCHSVAYLLDDPNDGVQEAFDPDPETCLHECEAAISEYVSERDLTRAIEDFNEMKRLGSTRDLLERYRLKNSDGEYDPDNP